METALRNFKFFGALVQKAGPYLLLEILMPGGTLFALLLFLYRQRQGPGAAKLPRVVVSVERAIGEVRKPVVFAARLSGLASAWRGRERERDGLEALAIAPTM